MPKVSIIIPTYNRAKLVTYAIESVLNQTYKNYEIIVVDDGSTDNTRELISKYGDKVKYFYKTNSGQGSARNFGIEKSVGEYIAFLDSDDLWLPERLKMGVVILEANKDVGLVYSNSYRLVDGKRMQRTYFDDYRPYNGFVFKQLFYQDFIPTTSVILRKQCFTKVGLFDGGLSPCEDYDMWLRISSCFQLEYIDKALVFHRRHSGNLISDIVALLKMQKKVLEKTYLRYSSLIKFFRRDARKKITLVSYLSCRYLVEEKRYEEAIKEIKKSIKLNILNWKIYILLLFSLFMNISRLAVSRVSKIYK